MGTSIILNTFFSFCNLKQLNIRYFNTNRKKFSVTVNFIQKEAKTGPKRVLLFCSVYQEVLGHFPENPNHFGRLLFGNLQLYSAPKMSNFFWKNKEKTIKKDREKKKACSLSLFAKQIDTFTVLNFTT